MAPSSYSDDLIYVWHQRVWKTSSPFLAVWILVQRRRFRHRITGSRPFRVHFGFGHHAEATSVAGVDDIGQRLAAGVRDICVQAQGGRH
jgi:hypothetical protein